MKDAAPVRKPVVWLGTEIKTPPFSEADAVIVAGVFPKKTERTPRKEIETCRRRLVEWDKA